jgi:hypothetical protein
MGLQPASRLAWRRHLSRFHHNVPNCGQHRSRTVSTSPTSAILWPWRARVDGRRVRSGPIRGWLDSAALTMAVFRSVFRSAGCESWTHVFSRGQVHAAMLEPPDAQIRRWRQLASAAAEARLVGSLLGVTHAVGARPGAGDGIRTSGGLLERYVALGGVAPRMARGAKPVQLSSRQPVLSGSMPEPHGCPCAHLGVKGWGRTKQRVAIAAHPLSIPPRQQRSSLGLSPWQ